MSTDNFGGGFYGGNRDGGFYGAGRGGGFYGGAESIEDRKRRRREAQARLGASLLANQPPPTPLGPAPAEFAKRPDEGGVWGGIKGVGSAIWKPISWWGENVQGPVGALVTDIPGQFDVGGLDNDGGKHRRAVAGAVSDLFTGKQSLGDTWRGLGELQKNRRFAAQLASETVSPVGLLESLVPIGHIASATKKIVTPVATTGTKAVPRMPSVSDMVSLVHDPHHVDGVLGKVARTSGATKVLRPNAIGDPDDVVYQFAISQDVGSEIAADSAKMMTMQVLRMGNPKDVFRLGDDFTSSAPGLEGLHVNVIAQHPEQYTLTPEMTSWLDNFAETTESLKRYLVEEGVLAADNLLDTTSGRYFPNVWATLNEIELNRTGGKALGAKQFYEQPRFYEEAADAIKEGFRPGDPMEGVALLYNSMYKQVLDKRILDVVKIYGKTVKQRMSPSLEFQQKAAKEQVSALRQLQVQLPKIGLEVRRLRSGGSFAGRTAIKKHAPDLLEDFDKALRTRKPHTREAAWQKLEAKLTARLDEATTNQANADAAYKKAKSVAGARPHLGEVQFPMTGLSGRIFSVDDILQYSNPEVALTDLSTLNREQIQKLSKLMRRPTRSWLDSVQDVSAMSRSLQAGLDLGAGAIHGAPLMLSRPALWGKTMGKSLEVMKNPVVMAQEIDLHWETVLKLVQRNQLHGGGSEYVQGLGKSGYLAKLGTLAERVGGPLTPAGKAWGRSLEAVEAQFNGFLTLGKVYLWEALEPSALRHGKDMFDKGRAGGKTLDEMYEAAYDDLGSHVSKFMGTISMANMGLRPTVRQLLGTLVMFAPRYRMAVYGLMSDIVKPGYKGDLARKSIGKMMAGGLLTYSAIAMRLGQEPNLDPTSGKFLTLQVGPQNIGLGSAFVSLTRFFAGVGASIEEDGFGVARIDQRDNPLTKFVRGQLSPISGTAWDVVSGRDYMGDPTTGSALDFATNVMAQRLLPFWISSLADTPRPGVLGPISEFGGLRSYPVSLSERATQLANIYALQDGDVLYSDMNRLQKNALREKHPDVQALFDENDQVWEARETGLSAKMTEYRNEVKDFRENVYNEHLNTAMAAFQKGTISPKLFRQKVKELGAGLGAKYEDLEERYPEVIDAFNEERQNPSAHLEDIAYGEYVRDVIAGDFEVTDPESQFYGQFDFKARLEAEEKFRQEWGQNIWAYAQARLEQSRARPPLLKEMYEGRKALEAYWRIGELMLEKMDRGDLVEDWRRYLRMRNFEQDEFAEDSPGVVRLFKQVASAQTRARQIHRERNPDIEAFLFRWGYVERLRNQENLDKDPRDLARTPVFFGQQ